MRPLAIALTVLALCLSTTGLALAAGGGSDTGRHVTSLTGNREAGFHVVWSDGVEWWTPTLSEDLSLCYEYDRPMRRGRCKAATRTKYSWMGVVKRSLRHHD
jgi:hypothetical protein